MAERLMIDKAIAHAREVARENKYRAEHKSFHRNDKDEISACLQCAEEHEQLAEWLEKLKYYEDLEEQGRMIILPEDEEKIQAMNEKLLELTDIAEAALKGAEHDNL